MKKEKKILQNDGVVNYCPVHAVFISGCFLLFLRINNYLFLGDISCRFGEASSQFTSNCRLQCSAVSETIFSLRTTARSPFIISSIREVDAEIFFKDLVSEQNAIEVGLLSTCYAYFFQKWFHRLR